MKLGFSKRVFLCLTHLAFFSSLKGTVQERERSMALGTSDDMGEYNQGKVCELNSLSGSLGTKRYFNPFGGHKTDLPVAGVNSDAKDEFALALTERSKSKSLITISVLPTFNFFKFEPCKEFKSNVKDNFSRAKRLAYRKTATAHLDEFRGLNTLGNFFNNVNTIGSYMTFQKGLAYTIFKQGCPNMVSKEWI